MDFTPYLGLARNPSTCEGSPQEDVINDGDQTLVYLDDVPELPLARIRRPGSWNARSNARLLASNSLNADLRAFLGGSFQARPLYSGLLGKAAYTNFMTVPSQAITLPFNMRYLQGGELIIRALGLILSEAVTNQVIGLYQVGNETALKTTTVASINARSTYQQILPEAWKIPMDGNRYEIRATLPDGVKIADNLLACGGCGGMGALQGMIENCCSGRASGFTMTLGGNCDYDPLLVQLMDNDRTKLVIAYMIAYQAGYVLCAAPPSGEVERSTVLSESDLQNAASACQAGYTNRLNWLKMEVPKLGLNVENTCFKPTTAFGWSRNGVFA